MFLLGLFISNFLLLCYSDSGQSFHKYAHFLVKNGNFQEALAYFRTAVRLSPNNSLYLNDLGVTEMRMGLFDKAFKRFKFALLLDENDSNLSENLAALTEGNTYLSNVDVEYFEDRPQLHKVLSAPLLNAENIPPLLDKPFVLKNAARIWDWHTENFNISDVFTNSSDLFMFSKARVDYYPQNMVDIKEAKPYFDTLIHSLNSFLKYDYDPDTDAEVFDNVDASKAGTYIQWNMNLKEWNDMMEILTGGGDYKILIPHWLLNEDWFNCLYINGASTEVYSNMDLETDIMNLGNERLYDLFFKHTHWRMMLIGEENAGMFFHKDLLQAPTWQIQLQGRKRWHICAPEEGEFLYRAGDVDTFRPNYKKYPEFLNAQCYDFILEPGDLIFYPEGYWHQTLNLETPTVSIGSTMLTKSSLKTIIKELKKECSGSQRIFPPIPVLCDTLTKCFEEWEIIFQP